MDSEVHCGKPAPRSGVVGGTVPVSKELIKRFKKGKRLLEIPGVDQHSGVVVVMQEDQRSLTQYDECSIDEFKRF